MPTVLAVDGFAVRIYTHDHSPAHVHVVRAGSVVAISLPTDSSEATIERVHGMSRANIRKALDLVNDNAELLQQKREGRPNPTAASMTTERCAERSLLMNGKNLIGKLTEVVLEQAAVLSEGWSVAKGPLVGPVVSCPFSCEGSV